MPVLLRTLLQLWENVATGLGRGMGGGSEAGFGHVVFQGDQKVAAGHHQMLEAEVFDAEAEGARYGLLDAIQHTVALPDMGEPKPDITVCLNNTAAIWCLQGTPSDTSQEAFMTFQEAADNFKDHYRNEVAVRCVLRHKGIIGKESVDRSAKEGVKEGELCNEQREIYLRLHQENRQTGLAQRL